MSTFRNFLYMFLLLVYPVISHSMTFGSRMLNVDTINFTCMAANIISQEEELVIEHATCVTEGKHIFIQDLDTGESYSLKVTDMCTTDFVCSKNNTNINQMTPLITNKENQLFYVFPYGLFYNTPPEEE